MFQRNGPSAGAEEAERLDLEKHARLEAGLIDPVSAIQPALWVDRLSCTTRMHAASG